MSPSGYTGKNYKSNPNLKSVGVKINWTADQIAERIKCINDPNYFIENYMKIISVDKGLVPFDMYNFQKDLVRKINNNRFLIAKLPRQVGKALDINTKIWTPSGYKLMKDVQPGDIVLGQDGKSTTVTWVSDIMYNRPCYTVTLDTGEIITADEEHLWTIGSSDWKHNEKTLTTKQCKDLLTKKQKNGSGLYININKAIEYKEQKLPIAPYVLGLWLGNGNSGDARITSQHTDYVHYKKILRKYGCFEHNYSDDKNIIFILEDAHSLLRQNNLLHNKHIPECYIFSSIKQRIELIQGLMDTNGHCRPNGGCEFYQKKKSIIDSFVQILSSLGIKSRTHSKAINNEMYYSVKFATKDFDVFTLPRKLERQNKLLGKEKNKRLYIQSIEATESVPVKCIAVDNTSKLYLCGERMTPTHNSTTIIAYILWVVLFGPMQNIAILANKSTTAKDILSKLQLAYEHIPLWMQQGVVAWNKGSIELENGSKIIATATASSSARGGTYNIIFLDEFAFVPKNIADNFFTSVYPTISSGQTTKVIIVSTPNGMNQFYRMWTDASQKRNKYLTFEVHWSQVPGRDQAWYEDTIANLGREKFDQEFECNFLGSSNTLISTVKLGTLAWIQPKQIISGNFYIYEYPLKGHTYVITVDVSRGQGKDFSVFSVIDCTTTPYRQVAKYKNNQISPLLFPQVIHNAALKYNNAYVLVEVNDIGGEVADILHQDCEYENIFYTTMKGRGGQSISQGHNNNSKLGLTTTNKMKSIGCANLKTLVESDKLIIEDYDTIAELTSFIATGKSYAAEDGCHDDLCMTLVFFGWLTTQEYFKDITDVNIQRKLYEEKMKSLEEEVLPFGKLEEERESFVDADGQRWEYVQEDLENNARFWNDLDYVYGNDEDD